MGFYNDMEKSLLEAIILKRDERQLTEKENELAIAITTFDKEENNEKTKRH